jgi:hypothetical protein
MSAEGESEATPSYRPAATRESPPGGLGFIHHRVAESDGRRRAVHSPQQQAPVKSLDRLGSRRESLGLDRESLTLSAEQGCQVGSTAAEEEELEHQQRPDVAHVLNGLIEPRGERVAARSGRLEDRALGSGIAR